MACRCKKAGFSTRATAIARARCCTKRATAEKFWPGQEPIGKRFGQGDDTSGWFEVVGVIGDIRSYRFARPTPYEFYRTVDRHVFLRILVHNHEHMGQAIAYARMNGIVPPWSAGGQ